MGRREGPGASGPGASKGRDFSGSLDLTFWGPDRILLEGTVEAEAYGQEGS